MTCFASIGVSQIQGYLARSRRLWGRRGASDMLAYLTDTSGAADRIEERSFETAGEILQGFPGVTVNDDAVDVDSVLNIRGEDPGEVRKAAEALALNIKLHLPAAHVHTTFREAAGYGDVIRAEDDDHLGAAVVVERDEGTATSSAPRTTTFLPKPGSTRRR